MTRLDKLTIPGYNKGRTMPPTDSLEWIYNGLVFLGRSIFWGMLFHAFIKCIFGERL